MDSIEKASFLMGKSYTKTQEGAAHSSNVTMITGTATSDSTDGVVSVDLGGNTISANDEQFVEVSTTCAVKAGDVVQVSVIGADGTAKSLLVTGVIAGGDRTEAKIENGINKSLYTRLEVNSTNGYSFKNGEGSTTLTASVFVGSENVTNTHVIKWFRDGEQIATGTTLTVNASDISNKAVFTVSAYKIATNDPSEAEITGTVDIINVDDGARGIQGLQGPKGEQGIPGKDGTNGTDGKTTYFHIKYSNVANPTESSQLSETPLTYIGTYVDFNSTDSTDPSKYSWTQFKGSQGKDGENGIPGKNGIDGKTSYLHVAYANSADGKTGFSVSDSVNKLYIGQYTDFASSDSTDPTKYSWTKIKGETGATGPKGDTGAKGKHGDDLSNGTMLYADPYFANGMNGTYVYDNLKKGNTKIERVARSSDNPFVNTNYELKITNTGEASPDCGGFSFGNAIRKNAKFIYRVIAKLPLGKPIQFVTNDIGKTSGGTWKWLTPRDGTGRFTEYIVEVDCGTGEDLSVWGTGFFYLNTAHGTPSNPIEWRVAYATCIDMTGASDAVIAKETANNTKTFFYNDSSGSHVKSKNASSSGTRADVRDDGLHVFDLDDGKDLASFTSNGASIGKDSKLHSKYTSDGVHFYEGGKSYPFSQIKPVTYENEKYSAAVFATAPDDISTDDGLYHSGATLAVTAINGTSNSNVGVGEAVLTATTVQTADLKSAYIDVFASNNNPNKASGGKTVEDTYINLVAEGIYFNSKPLIDYFYPIGKTWISADPTSPASIVGGSWEQIQDVFLLAAGSKYAAGKTGGEATHKLTASEMPAHTHDNGAGIMWKATTNSNSPIATPWNQKATLYHESYNSTGSTGGNGSHNNMPPYLAVYMWKRVA